MRKLLTARVLCVSHLRLYRLSRLAVVRPDLVREWATELNSDDVSTVHTSSENAVSWRCIECNSIWQCSVKERTDKDSGCPDCFKVEQRGQVSTLESIEVTHPQAARQWHKELNGALLSSAVDHLSSAVVWWESNSSEPPFQRSVAQFVANCLSPQAIQRSVLYAEFESLKDIAVAANFELPLVKIQSLLSDSAPPTLSNNQQLQLEQFWIKEQGSHVRKKIPTTRFPSSGTVNFAQVILNHYANTLVQLVQGVTGTSVPTFYQDRTKCLEYFKVKLPKRNEQVLVVVEPTPKVPIASRILPFLPQDEGEVPTPRVVPLPVLKVDGEHMMQESDMQGERREAQYLRSKPANDPIRTFRRRVNLFMPEDAVIRETRVPPVAISTVTLAPRVVAKRRHAAD